ncbi:MAG: hypothetical protein GWP69_11090 [Gammaproteobacteria bacterium]|jgi:hypothetical protein|nr:hypothetical protein [Gammaproteobacteria bacterium]
MLGSFKKAPKIEFFTNIDMLPEVIPVEHAAKAMPSWWKQTIVPLWCDLIFDYNNGEPRARTSAPDLFSVSFHSAGQFLDHAPSSVRTSTVAVMNLQ